MFLSHENHEEIVVKMIWPWSDMLHPREGYTDQYTHVLGVIAELSISRPLTTQSRHLIVAS